MDVGIDYRADWAQYSNRHRSSSAGRRACNRIITPLYEGTLDVTRMLLYRAHSHNIGCFYYCAVDECMMRDRIIAYEEARISEVHIMRCKQGKRDLRLAVGIYSR